MEQHFTGIIAATYTAMHEDRSVNLRTIEKQAHSLVLNGVTGAFVCGTTGEGLSLTANERRQVAERWVAVGKGSLNIIVHVGHTSIEVCKSLAAHAQNIGATAIASIAPVFFKPARVEDLVAFCAEIAASAPDLPFYYYHIPSMTGVRFPVFKFLEAAAGCIPNLAGVKFTHDNMMDLDQCLHLPAGDGTYDILFGRDELLLSALRLGVCGAVGSTYNFAAPLYQNILASFHLKEMETAEADQALSAEFISVMNQCGGLSAGKTIMKMIGLDCGPVRLPLRPLTTEEQESLEYELDRLGFFTRRSMV
ncbi:MAG: dihydrodipicolinate synthase family protein [Chloroflexi bacterium]|nr:dihydrodipicolinate synthase family protein [Chloroflexota bacterium]